MNRLMVIPVFKLGFISSFMLLMAAIVACGGNNEDEYWPCGPSSQCQSLTVSDKSVPDISAQIGYDTSLTYSQAVRLGTFLFESRKEVGNPRTAPKFLQIQDGRFVIHQFIGPPGQEALTPEQKASLEEGVCKISNEAFDGLSVTSIGHYLTADTYSVTDLADYALSTEQQPPHWTGSCGSGLAKKEDVKPVSVSDEDSTPKATSIPEVKSYSGCKGLEDLIPNLALPGTVTLSYYQVVNLGRDEVCDNIIEKVNKPENLKD